jgi:hypothetical protein
LLGRPCPLDLDAHEKRGHRRHRSLQAGKRRLRGRRCGIVDPERHIARRQRSEAIEQCRHGHRHALPTPRRHGEADHADDATRRVDERPAIRPGIHRRGRLDHTAGKRCLGLRLDIVEAADDSAAERRAAVGQHHVVDVAGGKGHVADRWQPPGQRKCRQRLLDGHLQKRHRERLIHRHDSGRPPLEARQQHGDLGGGRRHGAGRGQHVTFRRDEESRS